MPPVNVTFPDELRRRQRPAGGRIDAELPAQLGRPLGEERVGKLQRDGAVHPCVEPRSRQRDAPGALDVEAACRGDAGGVQLHRPAAKLAGRHDGERRQRIVRQHPGADALAADVEADGGGRERPAHAAPAGQGAAESAVPGDPVDEREGKRLQVEGDVEVAGAERNRALGPSRESRPR